MTPDVKILRARTALLMTQPFFGALAVQLIGVDATDDPRVMTMATDGRHLFWHGPFVDKLKPAELEFVLAHEILHNAFEHHIRRQTRDPQRWNIACDYAINGELVSYAEEAQKTTGAKAPPMVMPKGGLLDARFTGLSAEEIYRMLPDDAGGKGGAGGGADPGGCGGVLDGPPAHDEAAIAQARAEMQTQVRQAAAIAKASNAGTLPAGIQRIVDQLLQPKVDWRATLRRFIDQSQTRDYAWTRPNRRLLPQGIVLPSLVSDGIAHVVIGVDTSGSIDDEILRAFAAEINGVFGDGAVDRITVIYADAEVQRVDEFEAGDVLTIAPAGGGGTRFSPTFRWIEEHVGAPSAIVYLTDLECSDFGPAPGAPVLWAYHGDPRRLTQHAPKLPFGEPVPITV